MADKPKIKKASSYMPFKPSNFDTQSTFATKNYDTLIRVVNDLTTEKKKDSSSI